MTTTAPPALDPDKLMAFVFRAVDEVGATLNTALVVMGDKLGYYRLLAEGPLTAAQLMAQVEAITRSLEAGTITLEEFEDAKADLMERISID